MMLMNNNFYNYTGEKIFCPPEQMTHNSLAGIVIDYIQDRSFMWEESFILSIGYALEDSGWFGAACLGSP